MKRFVFWFALTLLGIVWLLHAVRLPHPDRVMVHESFGPAGRARQAYLDHDGKVVEFLPDGDRDADETDTGRDRGVRREPAEGLPVPVVPGTRTTEARAEPPSPSPGTRTAPRRPVRYGIRPRHPLKSEPAAVPSPDLLSVTGRLSATEERARRDARERLDALLAERLAPQVPRHWKVPAELVDGMIQEVIVTPRERDYGTVYEATLKVDVSTAMRDRVFAVYHRGEVVKRLVTLGAVLAFVLACLAAVSGYIKADEATKGYYTTRLRLAALAAVAAAGVVIARMLG